MCDEDGYIKIHFDEDETMDDRIAKINKEITFQGYRLNTFNSQLKTRENVPKEFGFDAFNPFS